MPRTWLGLSKRSQQSSFSLSVSTFLSQLVHPLVHPRSDPLPLPRRAAVLSHPGSMHRLGLAEINGELGLTKRPKDGVQWLKRAAELADQVDPPQPQSLHELAILHEKGIDNVIFQVSFPYSLSLRRSSWA